MYRRTRGIYNGGPRAGARVLTGTQLPNEGGWCNPLVAGNWSNSEAAMPFERDGPGDHQIVSQPQYQPGEKVPWTIRTSVVGGDSGDVATTLVPSQTPPQGSTTNWRARASSAGGVTSQTVYLRSDVFPGDRTIGSPLPFALPTSTVCTDRRP